MEIIIWAGVTLPDMSDCKFRRSSEARRDLDGWGGRVSVWEGLVFAIRRGRAILDM